MGGWVVSLSVLCVAEAAVSLALRLGLGGGAGAGSSAVRLGALAWRAVLNPLVVGPSPRLAFAPVKCWTAELTLQSQLHDCRANT